MFGRGSDAVGGDDMNLWSAMQGWVEDVEKRLKAVEEEGTALNGDVTSLTARMNSLERRERPAQGMPNTPGWVAQSIPVTSVTGTQTSQITPWCSCSELGGEWGSCIGCQINKL